VSSRSSASPYPQCLGNPLVPSPWTPSCPGDAPGTGVSHPCGLRVSQPCSALGGGVLPGALVAHPLHTAQPSSATSDMWRCSSLVISSRWAGAVLWDMYNAPDGLWWALVSAQYPSVYVASAIFLRHVRVTRMSTPVLRQISDTLKPSECSSSNNGWWVI